VLFGAKTESTLTPGTHGATFGGNPVSCAAALTVVKRLDEKVLQGVKDKSRYIADALKGCPKVKSITGLGLMLGLEVAGDAKQIAADCLTKGLIVLTAKDKLRLLPALNISPAELDRGLHILKGALQ